jgi:hypothetical protein
MGVSSPDTRHTREIAEIALRRALRHTKPLPPWLPPSQGVVFTDLQSLLDCQKTSLP